jgi:hypothetical protein
VQRFQREARAAAGLAHPNICPVFDIGQIDGVRYLTMRYVEGRSLAEVLRDGPPPAPAAAVALVRKVALAMAYAHGRGVTHRDLKPANIMLEGQSEPVVMDFGLARRSAPAEVRLTHDGAVLGTPAYMSPEQVRGDVPALGPATDIYSLGVILYELLTGRLPFQGSSGQVLQQILQASPLPPSSVRPSLDHRLDAISLRAMARDPGNRYPSMQALADALGAVAGDAALEDTVREMAPGRLRIRSRKAARVAAVLVGLVVLALLAVAVSGRWRERPAGAQDTPPSTLAPANDTRPAAPAADAGPKAQLDRPAVPVPSGPVVLKESRRFEGHTGAITAVACGGGGHPAVSTSQEDWTFRVWDVATGKEYEANRAQLITARSSFNADGRRYTYEDGFWVKVVDTGSGKEVRGVELSGDCQLGSHALSADGKWLAVSTFFSGEPNPGPYALAVNLETGKKYWFRGHKGQQKPEAVMVAPDGKCGASAGADALFVWDLAEPDSVKERQRIDRDSVISLAFSPDSELLLAGEKVDALILWNARTGRQQARFDGHIGPVNCVVFSPDGKWALSGGADHTARLWDVTTGKELARLLGHDGEVTCVAFAGQDRRALTGSTDKTVRLWDLAALAEAAPEADGPGK